MLTEIINLISKHDFDLELSDPEVLRSNPIKSKNNFASVMFI